MRNRKSSLTYDNELVAEIINNYNGENSNDLVLWTTA